MTREQFEDRRRTDVDFSDAYDDFAHYVRVEASLAAHAASREPVPMLAPIHLLAFVRSHGLVATLQSSGVVIHMPYTVQDDRTGNRYSGVDYIECRTMAEVRNALGY
jgi:hypothetical protein